MKKLCFSIITLLLSGSLKAQISNVIPSSVSIANTSVSDSQNWSAFSNPSTIGYLEKPEIGIQFENRYVISELSTKSVQFGLPTKLLNAGLSFSPRSFP